ncbi:MAG: DUF2672 domain-containing protein [Rickettsiaceae bacterium]
MKPKDITLIVKQYKKLRIYLSNIKKEILHHVDDNYHKYDNLSDIKAKEDVDELNAYLKQIIELDGKYDGNYSLNDVKNYHEQLTKINADK